MQKIGIFAGTFDPIHNGHINFALKSVENKKLDKVVFLPERKPRAKNDVTNYNHRLTILKLAVTPYDQLSVLELPDRKFTVEDSLPKIKKKYPDTELFFLFGSDVAQNIPSWPGAEKLENIIIGLRGNPPDPESQITGTAIRQGRLKNAVPEDVQKYIERHNLYQ